jgi:hypothetical protein
VGPLLVALRLVEMFAWVEDTQTCTATASDSGSWSCAPSGPLADGAYSLTGTATDAVASPVTSPPVQVTVAG